MKICPVCNGTGTQVLTCVEHGTQETKTVIECHFCKGEMYVIKDRLTAWNNYINSWCKCEQPDFENAIYFQEKNGHHGWNCSSCGKMLQEG
jgi:hypothetical protein